MQRDDIVTFDRPDRDDIEVIRNAAGIVISAHVIDRSVLAYLIRIDLADHGHEASATTFLDWQLSYTSVRGMKVAKYGQHGGGDGGSEKASKYLRLIRKLGHETQKTVEHCIDPHSALDQREAYRLRFIYLAALDKLGRLILATRKEFEDEAKKPVAPEGDPR
ncbi:hypothetical protein [Limnoglobus roseus]|uniref:Uncharacterized protein n=1 Tax=Limnoglobus roseus TaxID=2598579 RepID=A0A5C1AHR2_9BACT|nr:hypothetical protein [Limnoglobus roseus]QEL18731.1 hypothetical protein PX52LOC_05767 [Limnoglobus roseus]